MSSEKKRIENHHITRGIYLIVKQRQKNYQIVSFFLFTFVLSYIYYEEQEEDF
jgi:hypothetical protein